MSILSGLHYADAELLGDAAPFPRLPYALAFQFLDFPLLLVYAQSRCAAPPARVRAVGSAVRARAPWSHRTGKFAAVPVWSVNTVFWKRFPPERVERVKFT